MVEFFAEIAELEGRGVDVSGQTDAGVTRRLGLADPGASLSLTQERIRSGKLASSAKSYGDAARLERTLYKSGETSLLDVLDAERSLYSAEDALLQSRVSIATDYIALNKALGGGWDGVIDSTQPEIVDAKTGPRLASKPPKSKDIQG